MIDTLIDVGLTEEEINNIKNFIHDENKKDLEENIQQLKILGCDNLSIKNIIIGNPYFLGRSSSDINRLISGLKRLKFSYINLMFDSYPSFLNKDCFEIEDWINKKIYAGEYLDDILDLLDSNPSVIDEI